MFRRILIANRGEVAARVLRTCRRMGVQVVAIASSADRDLGWLEGADEVVTVGPPRASQSYLDQAAVLEAARRTGAAAIHPGWGFLSENATFANRCEAAGITFIGPPASLIGKLGDKVVARETMSALGLPVIPGSDGALLDLEDARRLADQIGYPVLIKAAAGGGGKGMRKVFSPEGLEAGFEEARAEGLSSFGDGTLYMEKLIVGGRHIEFQVLVDRFGHGIHLGERECSIQRRHQKLLEEGPSTAVSDALREGMGARVAGALARLGYRSAGTVEMLQDADGQLYFMEVNTRLQVEHPVSEMITGVDLVEWQLRIAANERLTLTQDQIRPSGHAIEARVNAEDPARGFRPSPGRVEALEFPAAEHLRVETHLRAGDAISPHYDSMVAKVIAHGATRQEAIERLAEALRGSRIDGVTTTIPLHLKILAREDFRRGDYDTTSLERWLRGED